MTRTPLTSARNPRVRWLRALLDDPGERRRQGLWVAEGVRLAGEVAAEGLPVRLWVTAEGWGRQGGREAELRARLEARGEPGLTVGRGLFRELADTQSPQGVLAVFEAPRFGPADVLRRPGPILILQALQDPGNLGTLARSAEAAGAAGVLAAPGTVDPGNPKALRASAGSLLRLPFAVADDPAALVAAAGRTLASTAGAGGTPYDRADLTVPLALWIGQEGRGLPPEALGPGSLVLTVPMEGRVESLNAATAAAVILFEAARQRRLSVPA